MREENFADIAFEMKDKLAFISMPYYSNDKEVSKQRFEQVLYLSYLLMLEGVHYMSPIISGHPVVERYQTPDNWDFWGKYCERILRNCDCLIIFQLEGWDKSGGVAEEIRIAQEMGLPIYVVTDQFKFIPHSY